LSRMKQTLALLLKFAVTLGIFVAIFIEYGGGYVPVRTADLAVPGTFEATNPDFPGLVGRLRARLHGAPLPPPRVPVSLADVCLAAAERAVFVRTTDGSTRRFKPLRHCGEGGLVTVFSPAAGGRFVPVRLAEAPPEVYFRLQGFQLVPAEPSELWAEIRSLRLGVFLPWFLAAMAIKLAGIFANVLRWQVLLRGQGIELGFGFLTRSYFIGRYFGIVTPSTMGLDAWRLYDTIRLTRRPVECTTVLGVERVLGLVGLFTVILLFMPFAARITRGQSFGELVAAMKLPLAGATLFAVPSASGEAVRELVFVWLLGTKAGAAKAFLIGNLGFWIEKIPLSVPGGLLLLLRRDPSLQALSREDLERVRREAEAV